MMKLSSSTISEFVKITNDSEKNKRTQTYGTIESKDGDFYVVLDGSDILTPFDNTVAVKKGDRVLVSLQNHTVTVYGNISDVSMGSSSIK